MSTFGTTETHRCRICNKICNTRCSRCHKVYYCGSSHKNEDWPNHKKECKYLVQQLSEETSKKKKEEDLIIKALEKLTLPSDQALTSYRNIVNVCDVACKAFTRKYLVPQDNIGYVGSTPMGVRGIEEEVQSDDQNNNQKTIIKKKFWFLTEIQGMDIQQSLDAFLAKGFTKDDYWSVFSLSKSSTFHSAFVSALRELELVHGFKFTYDGQMVAFYGLMNVIVKKQFDYLIPTFNWKSDDPSKWECDRSHSKGYQVIWIRLADDRRIFISFTAPMYGIFEYNEDGFPLWICDEEKQTYFKAHESVMPSAVDKAIALGMQNCEQTKDIRPKITLGCKSEILKKIINEGY